MSSSTALRKPLGVRATPEQHRMLTEAAAREHRSVSNFVLQAALKAAEQPAALPIALPLRFSASETESRVREAQELFRKSTLYDRDLVDELIQERRAEAARE